MAIDPSKPFDLEYTVDLAQDGMRLDRFVRQAVPTISRTRIQAYNREGRILVNGVNRAQNWRVKTGDQITLKCHVPEGGIDVAKNIPVEIIFEDDYLIGVNKQPGLVVHPVALHRHDTLMNALYWRYKDTLPPGKELSLVNRIDKYTSGVVLVSKDIRAKRDLQEQFEARTISKTYLALTLGVIEDEAGEITTPIGPALNRRNRCLMGIRHDEEGRPSHTHFEVLERFEKFTLIRLCPKTGRQHQLRVHMASISHPLAADHLYGNNLGLKFDLSKQSENEEDKQIPELGRFALHAETLTFRHPIENREMTLTAPLAPDFAGVLDALRRKESFSTFRLEGDIQIEEDAEDIEADSEESSNDASKQFDKLYGQNEFDSL